MQTYKTEAPSRPKRGVALGAIFALILGTSAAAEAPIADRGDDAAWLPVAAEAQAPAMSGPVPPGRPRVRDDYLPNTRWQEEHGADRAIWTRTMLSALESHGSEIDDTVPADIGEWCPAYETNTREERRAFWVGVMSAVAWYESRHIPDVVGANLYYGLTQILPATARGVGCRAATGQALLSGTANLSCAVRIMSVVVPDHEAVARAGGRNRGIASQWGPMTHGWARDEMKAWTREQDYCRVEPIRVEAAPRPPSRPGAAEPVESFVTRNATRFD